MVSPFLRFLCSRAGKIQREARCARFASPWGASPPQCPDRKVARDIPASVKGLVFFLFGFLVFFFVVFVFSGATGTCDLGMGPNSGIAGFSPFHVPGVHSGYFF